MIETDFLFGGLVAHLVLSIVVAVLGMDRQPGFLGSLVLALVFSPFVGIICVMSTPTKEDTARQKRILQLLEHQSQKAVLSPGG